jgi:hypothetical protein
MTTRTFSDVKVKAVDTVDAVVTTGPAAAAMVAGGIGALMIGLLTTLAEASEVIANALKFVKPVGPLSGKTILGVVAWLISWFLLNLALKDRDSNLSKAFTITLALIIAGLLLTFPPFFELFAAE